jgi:hypothetical protein
MFIPYGDEHDWLDENSNYVFARLGSLTHKQNPKRRFCDTQAMTALLDNLIRQPRLLPGERTAVIVICPVILDRNFPGSLETASRQGLSLDNHLDYICDQALSPRLFHELLHVAIPESKKRFLTDMAE